MANKKYFTDESLATLVDETKSYVDESVLDKLSMENERNVVIKNNFVNQIPISTDANGNIYNGTGFKTNTRWSNSGKAETSAAGHCITGYIPAKYNDVLRMKNVSIPCEYPYIVHFNSNKQVLAVSNISPNVDINGINTYVLAKQDVAYVRVVAGVIDSSSIITINDDMLSGSIELGWLTNGSGEKVAPNVFSTQILNEDGTLYAEKVDEKIDTHISNSDVHVTTTDKSNWNAAKSHADSTHAPSDAEKNQNAFGYIYNSNADIVYNALSTSDGIGFFGNAGIRVDIVEEPSGISVFLSNNGVTGIKGNSEHNYRKGDVNITKSDIGLGHVDDTSDRNKPVSTPQQEAIDYALEEAKKYTNSKVVVDSSLSTTSTNPVENQAITNWLADNVKQYKFTSSGSGTSSYLYLTSDDVSPVAAAPDGEENVVYAIDEYHLGVQWHNVANAPNFILKDDAELYTDTAISNLINSAPTTLDTLGEIATAMQENADVVEALDKAVGNKVDKVSGKGLSTNDLTATLKSNYDAAYLHVSNKSNPHGVTLSQLGVNATATELNYVDGVTSNIQTQLDGKAQVQIITWGADD